MFKYLLNILFIILQEPILSIDLSVYPKTIKRNDNYKGEFQAYVSGMDEITQMTLQNGNENINVNFEKITISNCEVLEFEKECILSLIGCQWSSDKCLSAIQCDQLIQSTCEKSTDILKDKCEWDLKNKKCKIKTLEIKTCNEIIIESDCESSLFGCQWSINKCLSATQCDQLSLIACDKVNNTLKDKCEWDSKNNICKNKMVDVVINSCNEYTKESDCKSSLFACQWSDNKCLSAIQCEQLSQSICENTTYILKDKCEWDLKNKKCKTKTLEINSCDEFINETECKSSLLGCQWSVNLCSHANECDQLSLIVCEKANNTLKDKCKWDTENNSCKNKEKICEEFNDSTECMNSDLGCQWYYEKCIDYFSCNQFGFPICLNTTGKFKDKCEWYEWNVGNVYHSYCREKSEINYNPNCKDITNEDCQKGLNGCYWISEKCIFPTQCSDFNEIICQDINSYSSFSGKCELNEKTKKCQRRALTSGLCSDNIDENDCSRSLIGCVWINNTCVIAHQCNLLSQSVCENLGSNARLRGKCEWNKDDEICLQKKSIRLIRNLVDDEITTKYKCSFNFPNIVENKNFDLIILDKNNNKASISLLLNSSESSNEDSDDNKFIIYRSSSFFLKNNLLVSFFLISFYL